MVKYLYRPHVTPIWLQEAGAGTSQQKSLLMLMKDGDKRKDVTVFYDGCPQFDGMDYDAAYSTTGYNLRKFLVTKEVSATYDNSPMNFPVLRYADVLLIKAEALTNLGKIADAETPLNRVRARAGLGNISGLSQVEMREVILHERRMELAFEGQRWFDLIRVDGGQWGLNFPSLYR